MTGKTVRLDAGFSVVSWSVERLEWKSIESRGGISFTPDQKKSIIAALDNYFTVLALETNRPAAKDVNRRLDAIARHARKLAEALSTLDAPGEVAVGTVWSWGAAPDPSVTRDWLFRLAVRADHHRAGGEHGSPRKGSMRELVAIVRPIWHDAGGEGRGCYSRPIHGDHAGPFLDMILGMIAQVAGDKMAGWTKPNIITVLTEK